MKLLQFYLKEDVNCKPHVGILKGDSDVQVLNVSGSARDVIRHLAGFERKSEELAALLESGAVYPLGDIQLLSPLTDPEKIICIGLNYHDHVIESNMQVPKVQFCFLNITTA